MRLDAWARRGARPTLGPESPPSSFSVRESLQPVPFRTIINPSQLTTRLFAAPPRGYPTTRDPATSGCITASRTAPRAGATYSSPTFNFNPYRAAYGRNRSTSSGACLTTSPRPCYDLRRPGNRARARLPAAPASWGGGVRSLTLCLPAKLHRPRQPFRLLGARQEPRDSDRTSARRRSRPCAAQLLLRGLRARCARKLQLRSCPYARPPCLLLLQLPSSGSSLPVREGRARSGAAAARRPNGLVFVRSCSPPVNRQLRRAIPARSQQEAPRGLTTSARARTLLRVLVRVTARFRAFEHGATSTSTSTTTTGLRLQVPWYSLPAISPAGAPAEPQPPSV